MPYVQYRVKNDEFYIYFNQVCILIFSINTFMYKTMIFVCSYLLYENLTLNDVTLLPTMKKCLWMTSYELVWTWSITTADSPTFFSQVFKKHVTMLNEWIAFYKHVCKFVGKTCLKKCQHFIKTNLLRVRHFFFFFPTFWVYNL